MFFIRMLTCHGWPPGNIPLNDGSFVMLGLGSTKPWPLIHWGHKQHKTKKMEHRNNIFDRPSTTKSPLIFWPFESIFRSFLRAKRNGCGFPRILQVLATKNKWDERTAEQNTMGVQKWGMPKSTAINIIKSYFPFIFKKRFSTFWDTPEFSALKLCQTFCTMKAPVFITWSQCVPCVSMLQRTRHASIPSTCATPCIAMLHCFHSKYFNASWDLLRFAFSTGSSSFVLKNTGFQSAACFRHLCVREWLKKMFADKTELWENKLWNETVRRLTSLLLRFCKEVLGSLLKV